jgi:hypothetical protein
MDEGAGGENEYLRAIRERLSDEVSPAGEGDPEDSALAAA